MPAVLLQNVSATLSDPRDAMLPVNVTASFASDSSLIASLVNINKLGTYYVSPVLFHAPSGGVIRVQWTDGRSVMQLLVTVLPQQDTSGRLLHNATVPALFAALYLLAALLISCSWVIPAFSSRLQIQVSRSISAPC